MNIIVQNMVNVSHVKGMKEHNKGNTNSFQSFFQTDEKPNGLNETEEHYIIIFLSLMKKVVM